MSYYAITIFTEWGLPPTSVAILFQVIIVCNSNPYEASLSFLWQACNFSYGFFSDQFSYGFADQFSYGFFFRPVFLWICLTSSFLMDVFDFQATITVGYLLSPIVMRCVDTRPQVKCEKAIYAQFDFFILFNFNY